MEGKSARTMQPPVGRLPILILMLLGMFLNFVPHARADEVDDFIHNEMKERHIPGLSLAVLRSGKPIKLKGYGFANLELDSPATPDTVYQLASLTKSFTATAILLLVQDGRLRLEDPVTRYVPEAPTIWEGVKIRNLLNQTSGIVEYLDESPDSPDSAIFSKTPVTPEALVAKIAQSPLEFAPGEQYRYRNTNYLLLSLVIRKVSGKPFDRFLEERLFRPLGMTSTRLTDETDILRHRAGGYSWTGEDWRNSPRLNPTVWDNGDGGIVSTVTDLAKWDAALYRNDLLHEEIRREMWQPTRLNDGSMSRYGYGWGIGDIKGHPTVWHAGGRPGTSTAIIRFTQDKLTVIALLNRDGINAAQIARQVATFFLRDLERVAYRPIRDRDPDRTMWVRDMLRSASQGNALPLPPGMALGVDGFRDPIHSARDLADSIRRLGMPQGTVFVERQEKEGTVYYRYRTLYSDARLIIGLWLDNKGHIVKMSFQQDG